VDTCAIFGDLHWHRAGGLVRVTTVTTRLRVHISRCLQSPFRRLTAPRNTLSDPTSSLPCSAARAQEYVCGSARHKKHLTKDRESTSRPRETGL
jgi:hypothetical protein